MKKYSIEAKELLTTVELYEIKAGATEKADSLQPSCGVMCSSCVGCTSCMACTSVMMDVIVIP